MGQKKQSKRNEYGVNQYSDGSHAVERPFTGSEHSRHPNEKIVERWVIGKLSSR